MLNTFDVDKFTERDLGISLNEIYPERDYDAIPVVDQSDELEAYLAFDEGALAEAPQALAAYVTDQQHYSV